MTVKPETPIELINDVYSKFDERVQQLRETLGRSLTVSEKILAAHLDDPSTVPERSKTYVDFRPDRVAMQDATAQMAWLQFQLAGLSEVAVPTTTHCDHLIQAKVNAKKDLLTAVDTNAEVYDFLKSVSSKYGAGFWEPGSGIIHQVVLENYAFPGGMMIGTDSHTPNGGGLAMIAIGVGGADAVDVMTGNPWNVRWPKLIGVELTGELNGWSSPKDVILKVAEILTAKGGTGAIVEYFGPGAISLSATGKGTICNMGAEIGATTSIFSYDESISRYLKATGRETTANAADAIAHHLRSDDEVIADPSKFYDQVISINLSELRPGINGPHTPDLARELPSLGAEAETNGWPLEISSALIGSCTNSSYEDITRAASIARQASANGLKLKTELLITPGSEQIRATIERDGLLADFEKLGATVLANACGPCIGQWDRSASREPGETNVIVTSYNRNFPKRNDGDAATLAFVTSPETVMALALAGRIDFDPISQTLTNDQGEEVKLDVPIGIELPEDGFDEGLDGFIAPESTQDIDVTISADSERLQELKPFPAWDGEEFTDLPILLKAKGKCTTDHISMAGPWLKYRGHLENISGNLYLGAVNAFVDDAIGEGKNQLNGETMSYPNIAKFYHEKDQPWVAIADENMGEGSSREHAAMEPRFRGCVMVLARSFARIHETNLKKQGIVPLTFADPADYDKIGEDDRLGTIDVSSLSPGSQVTVTVTKPDGSNWAFKGNHTFSDAQVEWFKAGSALAVIKNNLK